MSISPHTRMRQNDGSLCPLWVSITFLGGCWVSLRSPFQNGSLWVLHWRRGHDHRCPFCKTDWFPWQMVYKTNLNQWNPSVSKQTKANAMPVEPRTPITLRVGYVPFLKSPGPELQAGHQRKAMAGFIEPPLVAPSNCWSFLDGSQPSGSFDF